MSAQRKASHDAIGRAEKALDLIGIFIEYDEDSGTSDGDRTVEDGLDIMAGALGDLKGLDLDGPPLDQVLAEMGEDDALVETAAELIERLGQRSYAGLSQEDAETAEELRGELYDALRAILDRYKTEHDHA